MLQHLKFAARLLRRNMGFTIIAASTLALAIGATTAVFALLDTVLLRPLAYKNPEQLVSIVATQSQRGATSIGFNPLELDDLRNRSGIFESVSAVWPVSANLTGGDHPERIELLAASPSYFSMLGAKAQLGRVFGPQDEAQGFSEACLISDALWHRVFGGDPNILGRRIYLDTDGYTIVGVMPPGFRHPGRTVVDDVDVWGTAGFVADPFPHPPQRHQKLIPGAIGRLKPGISVEAAQARLTTFVSQLREEYPNFYSQANGWTLSLHPLTEDVVGKTSTLLWILFGAVGAMLLIGCINVANLLLSRASSREREIGIRLAIGASRRHVIVQLLTESLVLSAIATLAGVAVGWLMLRGIVIIAASKLPRLNEVTLNSHVLLFVTGLAIVTAILFGLAPALQSSSPNLVDTLGSSRSGGASRAQNRMREGLVVVEVAMSLVLLAGAGLLVRTMWRLISQDPGFNPNAVEVARFWLPVPNHPELDRYKTPVERTPFDREVLRRVQSLPGVEQAAMTGSLPLTGEQFNFRMAIEGETTDVRHAPVLQNVMVSPTYFQTMQTPLIGGRTFSESDDLNGAPVVVVDLTAAQRLWKGADAIGHRIGLYVDAAGNPLAQPRWFTVVGVVADVKQTALDAAAVPQIFFSLHQVNTRTLSVVARVKPGNTSAGQMAAIGEQMKRAVQAVDPELPVFGIQPMNNLVSASLTERRFSAELIGAFSLVALALAAIGVYGVIAYWVTQRTQELGVRMALGAQPSDVLKLVLGRSLRLALSGVAAGLLAASAVGPVLRSQLYGISTFDPLVFASIPAVLLLVALAAGYVPAVRAMRVDPMVALRYQ